MTQFLVPMNPEITLKEAISKFSTFLVSKTGCPFCVRAIDMFKMHNIHFVDFDHTVYKTLDKEVTEATSHKTYPKIYVDKEFVGGCSELHDYFKRKNITKSGRADDL